MVTVAKTRSARFRPALNLALTASRNSKAHYPTPERRMKSLHPADPAIAVLLPCYNEEQTIGAVVRGFREALPQATIYVYDNNSTDLTALQARAAGRCTVWCVPHCGTKTTPRISLTCGLSGGETP